MINKDRKLKIRRSQVEEAREFLEITKIAAGSPTPCGWGGCHSFDNLTAIICWDCNLSEAAESETLKIGAGNSTLLQQEMI